MSVNIQEQIREILNQTSGVNLFFALKQEDGNIVIRQADLKDGDTQRNLKTQFLSLLQEDFLGEEELQVEELSGADERNGVLYHYDMGEFPECLRYFSEFDYKKDYPKFVFGKDDLIHLEAYIIVIGTQETHCVLYKRFYPVFLLGRGSFCLIPSKQRFEELDREILRVSRDYQFIRAGSNIYIKDLKVLEKFGGFKSIIEKEASAAVDLIEGLNLLEESKILRETLAQDLSFARKLCRAGRHSPVLSNHIPNETIIEFSKSYPGLSGQLRYNEEGNRILLTTKKSQKLFLKLLDDSYLVSQLTNLYYESSSKECVVKAFSTKQPEGASVSNP